MWNERQRKVILVFLTGVALYLGVRAATHRMYVGNPQPLEGERAGELADRFDPNVATRAELAAIPGVGEKLAAAIVEYREGYAKLHAGKGPFNERTDLLAVQGIGVAKLEGMEGYLMFPGAVGKAASRRSAD